MIDPLTLAVIKNRLTSITREMGKILEKCAQAPTIGELHDSTAGIYDWDGGLVAQVEYLPPHIGGSRHALKSVIKTYREDFKIDINPGDTFLINYPYVYHGGGHLSDVSMIEPIFYRDEIISWAYTRGHQHDIGAALPTMGFIPGAYDIHGEGLIITPIKIFERGEERKDVFNLILSNVRDGDLVRVDLMAQYSCLQSAKKSILELLNKYGIDMYRDAIIELHNSAERAMRKEIKKMYDGKYCAESYASHDGKQDEGTHRPSSGPVYVRVELTIDGDDMIIDFSNTDKQVYFINSPYVNTEGYTFNAIFHTVDPLIDHVEGAYRPVKLIIPEGTAVNPKYPATVAACTITLGEVIYEAVQRALQQASPMDTAAIWGRHQTSIVSGFDTRKGKGNRYYIMPIFNSDGGSGATWGYDGWPAIGFCGFAGSATKAPIEFIEFLSPWIVEKCEFVTDSGGAGRFRGGVGTHWRMRHIADIPGFNHLEYDCCVPGLEARGHLGGKDAPICKLYVTRGGKTEQHSGGMHLIRTDPQCVIESIGQGGGGVGNPLEREIEKVEYDVKNGFVSIEKAKEDYGVIIDPVTLRADYEATEKLRKTKKEE